MFPGGDKDGCESTDASASIHHFSRLLGIHRQAKYVRMGLENCRHFNQFLEWKGDLEVSCAGSDDATTIMSDDDSSITLQLYIHLKQ